MFYLTTVFYPKWIVNQILLFAVIFLTDFFDGKLARQYKVETKAGAVFDVVADVFFVIISFTALIRNNFLPFWILPVAILKFAEFWITSLITVKTQREFKRVFVFDKLGKAAALLLYSLSIVSVLAFVIFPKPTAISLIIVYCTLVTLMSVISSAHRISSCIGQ
jgi:CDP-diacylglycerol--glycerol-3-phosphate 3-phosphatidyltransferase